MITVYESGFFSPSKGLSLAETAGLLTSDKVQRLTKNIRLADTHAEQNRLKAKLPVAFFAGTFKRNAAGPPRLSDLTEASGYMVLDWDNVEDTAALKKAVSRIPSTVLAFISPSGNGVKAVVNLCPAPGGPQAMREAFELVTAVYPEGIDVSGKNLNRACFLGWDNDYNLNLEPVPLIVGRHHRALNAINPDDGYDTWLNVLMALHSEDPVGNLSIAKAWSQKSVAYNEDEIDQKWRDFRPDGGITVRKMYELAGLEEELGSVITMDEAGLSKAIQVLGWPVYFNQRTQRLTIDDNSLAFNARDAELCRILAEKFQVQRGKEYGPARITKLNLYDMLPASVPHHDPFLDYLSGLAPFEGDSILRQVPATVLGCQGSFAEQEVFQKWMVGIISLQFNSLAPLDFVPILIGPQGDGKTRFASNLLPPALHTYYVDISLTATSDMARLLEKVIGCVIVEFSELQEGARISVGALRSLLSSTNLKARLAYRHDAANYPVTWGIIGTANPGSGVLPESAEGRRWYALPTNIASTGGPDKLHQWLEANRDAMWSEAYTLYQQGFKFQLSPEAQAARPLMNRKWERETLKVTREFLAEGKPFDVRDLKDAADYGRRMPKEIRAVIYQQGWNTRTCKIGAMTTTVYFPPDFDMATLKESLKEIEATRYVRLGD